MHYSIFGISTLVAAATLFHADIFSIGSTATLEVDDHSYLASDHLSITVAKPVALARLSGDEDDDDDEGDDDDDGGGGDIIFECTAYFTACDPPDDESCIYTGRDPNEEVARAEALNECKFENPMQGRYCMVESCEEIPRPDPDAS